MTPNCSKQMKIAGILAAALALGGCASAPVETSFAGYQGDHWVSTWTAAVQETAQPNGPGLPGRPAPLTNFADQTIRMIAHVSTGGPALRVELSNTFGDQMIRIGAARIARHESGSAIDSVSDQALMFSGSASAMIPAGASIVSDPVELTVPDMSHVAISLYLPEDTGLPTRHGVGLHPAYIIAGDHTAEASFAADSESNSWFFLSGIDVRGTGDEATIVAFGDSITDGVGSEQNADHDWPTLLTQRLHEAGATKLAMANQGISGNRVLRDGTGPNALARFNRDVLAIPGARYVIVMEGINDIGQGLREGADPANAVTAEDLIAAHTQLVERAHQHGIKAIGATLTPYEGAGYYSEAGEAVRMEVNQWIRNGGVYDAVLDFDAAVQDPANPGRIRADFTRDNLHPNDAGYAAMVASVDLAVFGVEVPVQ